MEKFLAEVRKFAYDEVKRTGSPVKANVDLATKKGKELAEKLGANINIVEAGTLLMDCMHGQATIEGRMGDHIQMSLDKTNEFLANSTLSESEKENIRYCVLEHHGVDKFYSLESEICCNADCYRFVSVQGFMFATRYLREMPFMDLVKLLDAKVEEKWNVMSLDAVKEELVSEYNVIKKILEVLKSSTPSQSV